MSPALAEGEGAIRGRAADWFGFAASPTFVVMGLVTAVSSGGSAAMLCSGTPGAPLTGMLPMYLLMGAFHLTPWLRRISSRQR